jgi:3-oxoisoapionate kinase
MSNDLVLTYYGDDFTGSTDVMEQLELGGVPTVLFLDIPTDEQLAAFPDVQAVGIAGISRSMSPEEMDAELVPKFKALAALSAPFFHYKVCSTFDSSPTVGSIGHATDIGWQVFEPPFVPLVIGAPFLRRYVAFGNLFARVGDVTYRLDRHPTMSRHPVTPMTEANLGQHLSHQTNRQVGLIDYWHMTTKSPGDLDVYINQRITEGNEILVFDTLDDDHLQIIGRILWDQRGEKPVFMVGSSGIERALTLHLATIRDAAPQTNLKAPGPVSQIIVMSGSAAPGTHDQIAYALEQGFVGLRLDTAALIDPTTADQAREQIIQQALQVIAAGSNPLMYAALGPDDPAIEATRQRGQSLGLASHTVGQRLGEQQGAITKALLENSDVRRGCIAGGDTSGHTSHQLGIYALQAIQSISPGAPLCRASSSDPRFDGLEISLKGGQNGGVSYFTAIQAGEP